jgi:hypothetical protein
MRLLLCAVVALSAAGAWAQVPSTVTGRSVKPQVEAAQQARQRTAELPASAYERPADINRHRALVSDIDTTAQLVERRASTLSARDLALSKYYLAQANDKAEVLSTRSLQPISAGSVAELRTAVAPVRTLRAKLTSGQPPFGYRKVVVTVKAPAGQPEPPRLRVYVLPSGVLDRPEYFGIDTIREWLQAFSFEEPTSPSRGTVPQGEMRVWVGPDKMYEAMAKRVFERQPIAFALLHIAPDNAPELALRFNAPGDIVKP